MLVHQVLARSEEHTVVDDVTALLDLSTPLYKARLEELAPQSQLVVDALALALDPQPAGEITKRLGLKGNVVSAQLSRLVNDGVVEKASYPGARAGYQIAERLFNIWYLMRASRRTRRKLLWLVSFLREFYGFLALAAASRDGRRGRRRPSGGRAFPPRALRIPRARSRESRRSPRTAPAIGRASFSSRSTNTRYSSGARVEEHLEHGRASIPTARTAISPSRRNGWPRVRPDRPEAGLR